MTLYKNELREIFRTRTYGEKKILTWRGLQRIKLLDKGAALHDIWDAFCREFGEQRQFLEDEIASMRQEIEAQKEQSDEDLVQSAPGYVFEELRVLFKQLEKELGELLPQLNGNRPAAFDKIKDVLAQDYDGQLAVVDRGEKDSKEQMGRLKRRLERMAKDLQLSEGEVTRLRRELAQAYDGGVASIYKDVQGLSEDETNAETKKDLLSKLFQSNVELRKNIG